MNTFFGLEYAQPVPPHYTLIGPVLSYEAEVQAVGNDMCNGSQSQNAAVLENCPEMFWLDELIRKNEQIHVILINFGTTGVLKPRQLQAMLEGFAELRANESTSGAGLFVFPSRFRLILCKPFMFCGVFRRSITDTRLEPGICQTLRSLHTYVSSLGYALKSRFCAILPFICLSVTLESTRFKKQLLLAYRFLL